MLFEPELDFISGGGRRAAVTREYLDNASWKPA